jgi:hypothetical protein
MKCILSTPGRPSDAGPEQGAPMDCGDYMDAAADEIRDAMRVDRADVRVADRLRREHLEAAQDWIVRALEVLK